MIKHDTRMKPSVSRPEDGSDVFHGSVDWLSSDHTESYLTRQNTFISNALKTPCPINLSKIISAIAAEYGLYG
jgi:hypothetical protein